MGTVLPFASLLTAASEEEAWQQLHGAVRGLGFDHSLFAVLPQPRQAPDQVYLRSSYPTSWRQHYDNTNLRAIDPTVAHCFKSAAPMLWMDHSFTTPAQQALYEDASSFGLRVGVTLPIRGANGEVGMLNCVRDQAPSQAFGRDLQATLGSLSLLRDIASDAFAPYFQTTGNAALPTLTARERDCLQWMAAGKTAWEIGRLLSISEAGVNFHIANLRTKFGVSRRNDVVIQALRLGLIALPG
jgi:LuxR family quorum-sensing transcriptional regulator LasR